MSAKEMFEKLGYKFEDKFEGLFRIFRYKKDNYNIIVFILLGASWFPTKRFYKTGEYDSACDPITMRELKAINKQVEELGWK